MTDPGRLAVADALCKIMAARHPGTHWVALERSARTSMRRVKLSFGSCACCTKGERMPFKDPIARGAGGMSTPLQPGQSDARERVLSVDLTGSNLGSMWISVELVVDQPADWSDDRLVRAAAAFYGVPSAQVVLYPKPVATPAKKTRAKKTARPRAAAPATDAFGDAMPGAFSEWNKA